MEAEGEVSRRRDETHRAEGDLGEGVDERSQWRLLADCGLTERLAVRGKNAGPEVQRVDVLPVVDGLVRVV